MSLLLLIVTLATMWFTGVLGAAEGPARTQAAPVAKAERFGVRCYADGSWQPLPAALPERLVLLVHGLDEPGELWRDLAPALTEAGMPAARFDYPNDQGAVQSGALFGSWLPRLRQRGTKQIVIVGHSMGGLVSREYLTDPALDYRKRLQDGSVPRIRTLIMVGTPNQGSPMARFRLVAELREQWTRFLRGDGELLGAMADGDGEAGQDLLPGSEFLIGLNARELPRDVRFAIVAGIVSPLGEEDLANAASHWQQSLPGFLHGSVGQVERQLAEVANGMGDGVVSVASTRLPGVDDHTAVRGNHISMLQGDGKPHHELPPAVPIILDRVRQTWPGRFPTIDPPNQETKP